MNKQSRRDLLKTAAALSAVASVTKIGTTRANAATDAGKKDALSRIDQVLRQSADAKEVAGVVAMAATDDGILIPGRLWQARPRQGDGGSRR